MLDPKYIRDNLEAVKHNILKRGVKADATLVIDLYNSRNKLQFEIDTLRNDRNENASKMKQKLPEGERAVLIEEGKNIKVKVAELEEKIKEIELKYTEEAMKIPNMTDSSCPVGGEADSVELRKEGVIRNFSFKPKDHVELGDILDVIDFDSGANVSGQKFYYLKNEGALLELALINFGMQYMTKKGFTPYLTPDIAKASILEGIGFNPRGSETNIYSIENTDQCLVGTAEITLGGIYRDTIIDESALPVKMAGFSHCFRTEAGASGQATKGLYRVHQFSKVEMFVICTPSESEKMLETLREIEEEIYKALGIPYRVLNIATGDLGNPAYKKYDLEAWMPGRGCYGEITSTSNCTDFQARRLNTRIKDKAGNKNIAHMLNGTVIAVPRVIISILENYQNEDGTVDIPEILVPFTGFSKITRKK
ncbi:MAG: serine--tRNA ligase [Spirochaetes bacterium GWF1_31_7]|nr:MAG: serine--tRNA ligase [Spirochaetes bacterium GWE1_32_154]OHD49162.1 MAG: serine--tRNA ligase [Spirochaetes bacterium GWF1_31_7]OHD50253.1 MAG: serine--tRNA ligase [Spirochaetes bacterium GWE2_31_10]OHD76607.1 MAG: serine--tRNA ligase [Spirochaetes bacterium RIFOXYB1_FULL_32_8]HBD93964.1 serine--tRNA ligase [Spirochaetia bacterium]